MKIAFPSIEFDDAVAALCHGEASDEQVSALNELLRSDSVARDEYILRLELHSRLASEPDLFASTSPASTPLEKDEVNLKRQDDVRTRAVLRRRTGALWFAAIAASVALAVTAFWTWNLASQTRAAATSRAVAMLNETASARWANSAQTPEMGAPMEPGRLALEDGLAQVVFYSGARMVIEGPAEIQLISANHALVRRGKITAEVPPQARGFRIDTPQGKITDLGTSFGVEVREGRTEVHVFKGEVKVEAAFARTEDNLLEGAGAVLETTAITRRIPANETAFESLFDLQSKSSAAEAQRLHQWRTAGKRLNGDPSLLVRFDFDDPTPSRWQVPNLSQESDLTGNAVIVGCRRGEGRWPGKSALEFQSVSDRLRLDITGEFDSLTMATWVRIQGLDRKLNSLFMSDGFAPGSVHWLVRNDGVLGLTIVGGEAGKYQIAASPPVVTLDRFGMWLHLAVVLDGRSGRVVHYVNGRRVGENNLQIKPPYRINTAELGNWNAKGYPKNDPFVIRNFSGAMDEFCLLSRALGDHEIERLYAEGRPDAAAVLP